MGEHDKQLKVYLNDSRRYADMINAGIFGGRQMVLPEDLLPERTVNTKADTVISKERTSDLAMRQCKNGEKYAIWILENQSSIDYSMPIRVLLKEALEYDDQLRNIKKMNSKKGVIYANEGEFLSKVKRTDKLYPVHTLVLYWGKEPWDGPKSLHDILDFSCDNQEDLKRLKEITPEYPLLLFDLSSKKDYSEFKTELRTVFELYTLREQKEDFYRYLKTHEECKDMDEETYHLISTMTNEQRTFAWLQKQNNQENLRPKGGINMCKAIDDLINDAFEKGRLTEREEGCKAINDLISDAFEKGRMAEREEGCKAINDLINDARQEGFEKGRMAEGEELSSLKSELSLKDAEIASLKARIAQLNK